MYVFHRQQSVFVFVCLSTPASVPIWAVFAAVHHLHQPTNGLLYNGPPVDGGREKGSGTNGGFKTKKGNVRRREGGSDAPLATCCRSIHGAVNRLCCCPFFSCNPPHNTLLVQLDLFFIEELSATNRQPFLQHLPHLTSLVRLASSPYMQRISRVTGGLIQPSLSSRPRWVQKDVGGEMKRIQSAVSALFRRSNSQSI